MTATVHPLPTPTTAACHRHLLWIAGQAHLLCKCHWMTAASKENGR